MGNQRESPILESWKISPLEETLVNYKRDIGASLNLGHLQDASTELEVLRLCIFHNYKKGRLTFPEVKWHYLSYINFINRYENQYTEGYKK